MNIKRDVIEQLYNGLPDETKGVVDQAVAKLTAVKNDGGKVVVVTGSGPNIHEGVTTLIAEMIRKGLVDGVTTSSAVIAHEMAGVLDRVKRVDGRRVGIDATLLPKGYTFEVTILTPQWQEIIANEMELNHELMEAVLATEGEIIIKAAGNMAYPMGLRTERLAMDIMTVAKQEELPFEQVAGEAADPRTMLGAAQRKNIPVLVTVPQLVGGGMVGIAVADSISIRERCRRIAAMLEAADVIIESGVALTQEIHDGPFETYTGHGIWTRWQGEPAFSLAGKTLIRIDLDPNLRKAWDFERRSGEVQKAIDQGLPKTKLMDIPFRMEMSGFARLEGSIPVVGDIGVIWPVIAWRLEQELGLTLDFMSCPQHLPEGQAMRKWIVDNIEPIDRSQFCEIKAC